MSFFSRSASSQPLIPDQANVQVFYYFDPSAEPPRWRPASSSSDIDPQHQHQRQHTDPSTEPATDKLHLISWNIDFQVPAPRERMTAALAYLNDLLTEHATQHPNPAPTVIFFQEMVASDLELIQNTPWVQERFYITDRSPTKWRMSSYGTSTLIDRRLSIERVFRVPYAASFMQRDGLFVDIGFNSDIPSDKMGVKSPTIRLCNTHLESLASGTPKRPLQVKIASEFMHGRRQENGLPAPNGAILAGDLNAIAPEDALIPGDCDLNDAFLVLGGEEETEDAYTWGKQNAGWLVGKFSDARLDKVLFCGGLEVKSLRKIGVGLKARVSVRMSDSDEEQREEEVDDEDDFEDIWVTDHFGLAAEFEVKQTAAREV
ncbi:Endonuclease/exonuclease/phosphatase [Aspergillus karnatakaensis]|uniref:endonuclease/exonuclease/phosphatase family protein n=1 Tax=Aspergillus karnatakaensis TaxID=1810916 RepID=UPI003CCD1493